MLTPIEECDLLVAQLRGRLAPELQELLRTADAETLRALYVDLESGGNQRDHTRNELDVALDGELERRAHQRQMAEAIRSFLSGQGEIELPADRWPREHQEGALASLAEFLEKGHLRGSVVLPTGTGKTVVMSSLIRLTSARTLIVVPTKPLLVQAIEEYEHYLNDTDMLVEDLSPLGQVSSLRDETVTFAANTLHAQVVVTTLSSLQRKADLFAQEKWDLVLIDEVHTALTERTQAALRGLGTAPRIGFTATPDYLYTRRPSRSSDDVDEVSVGDRRMWRDLRRSTSRYFPHEIERIELEDALRDGLVAPVRAAIVTVDVPLSDIDARETALGLDFEVSALAQRFDEYWDVIVAAALDVYRSPKESTGITGFEGRRAVAVLPTVRHAEQLAAAFNEVGITAAPISGQTPDGERRRLLAAHAKGEIQILTSVRLLGLGWDSPKTEVLLMLRPTHSRLLYQQILGRVLRLDPDDAEKEALVIDFLGSYVDHAPLTAPGLFGKSAVHNGELLITPHVQTAKAQSGDGSEGAAPAPRYGVSTELTLIEEAREDPTLLLEDDDGFLRDGDVLYLTNEALSRAMKMERVAMKRRLKKHGITPRRGKLRNGHAYPVYPVVAARAACADRFDPSLLFPDADGIFRDGDTVYGTKKWLAEELNVHPQTINRRMAILHDQGTPLASRLGMLGSGNIVPMYSLKAVAEAVATSIARYELAPPLLASEEGYVTHEDVEYLTPEALAREMLLDHESGTQLVRRRLADKEIGGGSERVAQTSVGARSTRLQLRALHVQIFAIRRCFRLNLTERSAMGTRCMRRCRGS
jgi:superfamily II DNA or RNA helicase